MSPKPFTSVWTREPRGRREQGLTRDQIVKAAVEILDADGLDALSMRKLGTKLGAGATSLYWHVAHKDELLELVMDEAYGEVRLQPGRGWRETANEFSYGLRAAMLRHLWLGPLIGVIPSLGPQALRVASTLVDAFTRGGFRGMDGDFAVASVMSYTVGATLPEASCADPVTEKELMDTLGQVFGQATTDHPALRERYLTYASPDFNPRIARQLGFDYGLVAMLDGLAERLRQAGAREAGSREAGSREAKASPASPATSSTDQRR